VSKLRLLSGLASGVALTAGGLFLGSQGDVLGWWLGVAFAVLTVLLAWFNLILLTSVDDIEVSAWGVRRSVGSRWARWARKVEVVSWGALSKVEIVTNALGPDAEDMFFLLHDTDNKGVLVPGALALKHGLLEELQRRLPGFDNRAVVEASGSTTNARFLVWQRNRSEAISG
jgi:hypothetical protein